MILCILILVPTNLGVNALSTQYAQTVNSSSQNHTSMTKVVSATHLAVWCHLFNMHLGKISERSYLAYLHFCTKNTSSPSSKQNTLVKTPSIIPMAFDTSIIPAAYGFQDTGPSNPITQINTDPITPNGTKRTESEVSIAVSGNNIVAGYNDDQDPNTSTYTGYSYSNDGGKTWVDGGGIVPNPGDFDANDPSIVVDSKGNFYFAMDVANGTHSKIGVAKSTDGGKTFGNPVIIDSVNASIPADLDKNYLGVGKNPANSSQDIIHTTYTRFGSSSSQIIYKRSLDGGLTWQDSCTLNPNGDAEGSMPVVDKTGNTVYIFYEDFVTNKIVGWKNTHAGAGCLWTRLADVGVIHPLITHPICGGIFAVWNGNHRETQIPVAAIGSNGNLYVAWNDSPDGGKTTEIVLFRSTDGGNTWIGPQTFSPTPGRDQFEPWIAVAPNGIITMIFYDRVNDPNNLLMDLYAVTSTDNGNTWQPNQRITPSSFSWGTLIPSSDPFFFPCYFIGEYQAITFDSNNVAHIAWSDGSVIASDGTPKPDVFYTQLTPASPPTAPLNLQASAGNAHVFLSWNAPSNNGGSPITNYKIYKSTSSGTESLFATFGNVTSFNDTSVTNGQTYFYKVSAVNSVGESTQSNETSATTFTIPQQPNGLAATAASSSQVSLSWTAPSNNGGSAITGYKIERSTDNGTTWSTIQSNTGSTVTTYSDTGLTASTNYTYRVSAINSIGTSTPSNTASAKTDPIQLTISVKSVDLSGNPITGMSTVIRYTNGTTIHESFTPVSFTVTSGTTYVVHIRDYLTTMFNHWQDGSTNSYYIITPTQNVTLTAYYSTG